MNGSEMLVAVWDGKLATGLGGTADAVGYALQCGKRIVHLDPVSRTVNKINYD